METHDLDRLEWREVAICKCGFRTRSYVNREDAFTEMEEHIEREVNNDHRTTPRN